MAASENKRPSRSKEGVMKASKRRRLEDVVQKSESKTKKTPRTVASVGALSWKAVSMPDRLDDYEGFFGLEEVDDVEIVRDGATGQISYFASSTDQTALTNQDEGYGDVDIEDDAPEWNGFGEDEIKDMQHTGKPVKAAKSLAVSKADNRNAGSTKSQPKPKAKRTSEGTKTSVTSFASLRDRSDDSAGVSVAAWRSLKLSPDIMASLARMKFSAPTLIQRSAIPEILAGHDVVGKASTGSGKTLAFGIPILERFLERRHGDQRPKISPKSPLALIMSPTRELAHQIEKHMAALCSDGLFDEPLIATLTGGLSLQKQQRLLKGADIVIATPGRLWEIISSGQGVIAALKQIQFLVIDEADRLLSDGHFKELEEILNALERSDDPSEEGQSSEDHIRSSEEFNRQTLIFSATFNRDLQRKLAGKGISGGNLMSNTETLEYLISKLNFREDHPKFIDVNPVRQMAVGLKEGLVECGGTEKDLYLYTLLLLHPNTRALVFTNSISAVRRVAPFLQNLNLHALALHSGMAQKARLRSVERFTQTDLGKSSILVATDVAARGLDIPGVQLIIHYHLPRAADMYVHRSGRTARAGQSGSSILICAPEEVSGVRRLVAKVHAQSGAEHDQDASGAAKQGYYIRTLDMDRRIVSRLKPRATLAKKLADITMAKEKQHKEDDFMRAAAEELGVDYDSEEFDNASKGRRGRGGGRKAKERQSREHTKSEVATMKAELKDLLKQRVNAGVSERYLTSGTVDIDELLRRQEATSGTNGEFLGNVNGLAME